MTFEYYFIKYWWRIYLGLLIIVAPFAWVWIPTVMLTILFTTLVGVGAVFGVRRLYKRITRPSCTCCTAGDSCDCDRHCKLHHVGLPRAEWRR